MLCRQQKCSETNFNFQRKLTLGLYVAGVLLIGTLMKVSINIVIDFFKSALVVQERVKRFAIFQAIWYFKYFSVCSLDRVYGGVDWWCFAKDQFQPITYECFCLIVVQPFQERPHILQQKVSPTLVCLWGWCYLLWNFWASFVPQVNSSWDFHIINFFCRCLCAQSFFPQVA